MRRSWSLCSPLLVEPPSNCVGSLCCSSCVVICADHIAFIDLFADRSNRHCSKPSHVSLLLSSAMVKYQHQRISLAAVNTRMGLQIVVDPNLLLFAALFPALSVTCTVRFCFGTSLAFPSFARGIEVSVLFRKPMPVSAACLLWVCHVFLSQLQGPRDQPSACVGKTSQLQVISLRLRP
jgi:hypothetical protein